MAKSIDAWAIARSDGTLTNSVGETSNEAWSNFLFVWRPFDSEQSYIHCKNMFEDQGNRAVPVTITVKDE